MQEASEYLISVFLTLYWCLNDTLSTRITPTPKIILIVASTSPPTEAISLPEVLCAEARTHGRLARTSASPRECLPSSRQSSKPVIDLHRRRRHPRFGAKT